MNIMATILKSKIIGKTLLALGKIDVRIGNHAFKTSRYLEIKKTISNEPKSFYAFVSANKNHISYFLEKAILKSKYSHSGLICVGNDSDDITCVHVEGDGLKITHILDLLDTCDKFALIKLPIKQENYPKACSRLLDIIENKEKYIYDTEFNLDDKYSNDKRIFSYCSELVLDFGEGLVDDPDFSPHFQLGVKCFSPDDLLKCGVLVFSS